MKKALAKLLCLRGEGLISSLRDWGVLLPCGLGEYHRGGAELQLSVLSSWVCLGEELEKVTRPEPARQIPSQSLNYAVSLK